MWISSAMMVLESCILFESEGEHSPTPIHRRDLTCPPDQLPLALVLGTLWLSGDQHPEDFGEYEVSPTHVKCVCITAIVATQTHTKIRASPSVPLLVCIYPCWRCIHVT